MKVARPGSLLPSVASKRGRRCAVRVCSACVCVSARAHLPISLFRPPGIAPMQPLFHLRALLFLFWQHIQRFARVHKQSSILSFQVRYQESMAHLGERKWTHVFPFLVVGIYVHTGLSSLQR